MTFKGEAIAYGAATIVNAIALGKGAALGVDLWTKAEVILTDDPNIIQGEIISDSTEDTSLIEKAVDRVFRYFDLQKEVGAKIKTWSNIPIARGLKSSSTAANAVVLATLKVLNKKIDDLSIVSLGVDAAFEAGVTITGAFDDACASFFGGVVMTDNLNRKLLKRNQIPENATILFFVPKQKVYTANTKISRLKSIKSLVNIAFREAMEGNYWTALSLNGFIYSSVLGYGSDLAFESLEAGALASGLCGKGPAVTAVVTNDKIDEVKSVFQRYDGDIIETCINHKKAAVIEK
ncbi:shikimate kinase [Candidatus Bathyarchaeota archaeon]|nr:shikimate kinase [Candidatus Bathyarchaeota archaeon]